MTQQEGTFTIPTRVFLSERHRARLQRLVLQEGVDLPALVTELLVSYLDRLPAEVTAPEPQRPDQRADLQRRRAELQRVRAQQQAAGKNAPTWLAGYIADLEGEIENMQAKGDGRKTRG